MRHHVACGLAVMVAASALAGASASPAFAHATLIDTSPAHGAVLEQAPEVVRLRFDERVGLVPTSVRVYDSDAQRVEVGDAEQPTDGVVEVRLPGDLAEDTYTVAWRVLSEDSHPIRGAFVFSVGEPVRGGVGVAEQILDEDADSAPVDWSLWLVRFLGLALVLACVGGAAVLAFVVDTPTTRARALWLALGGSAALLAVDSLALIALTGVKVAGLGLGDVFGYSASREVLETSFGQVWLARTVLAAALAAVALVAARRKPERWLVASVLLAFSIGVTPALSGHARVEGALAVLSDAVHVTAAGIWAGGLAFLALLLVEAGGDRWSRAATVVPRFSLLAVGSVIALVASGVVNGLFEVGSLAALWETTYGQLVLAKMALLVPLLALGAFNNRVSVPALRAAKAGPELRRRFSRAVALELGVMVAVVGVTAALVAEPPANARGTGGTLTREGELGPFLYTLTVEPARAGRNEVHAYVLEPTGQPAQVDEVALTATLAAPEVGPLELEATPAGPGHVVVTAAELPLTGDWTIDVDVRRGEFDAWNATVDTPIGKD
ncbi:MAG: CopD family protein [Gaiellaceae bacterium]